VAIAHHPFDMEVFQHNHPEAAHQVRTKLMEDILALGGNPGMEPRRAVSRLGTIAGALDLA